jgi:hypothetical protein
MFLLSTTTFSNCLLFKTCSPPNLAQENILSADPKDVTVRIICPLLHVQDAPYPLERLATCLNMLYQINNLNMGIKPVFLDLQSLEDIPFPISFR